MINLAVLPDGGLTTGGTMTVGSREIGIASGSTCGNPVVDLEMVMCTSAINLQKKLTGKHAAVQYTNL